MSPVDGARTWVHLATSPDVEGVSGSYFSRGRAVPLSEVASDPAAARRLWDESERLIAQHPAPTRG